MNHEYEQAIMEARSSNQRTRKSKAMSKAWRVITDAFVQSMLIKTAQKPKYMQYKGKALRFFQATEGGFTKPGKIGEVALQVRQLQNWVHWWVPPYLHFFSSFVGRCAFPALPRVIICIILSTMSL